MATLATMLALNSAHAADSDFPALVSFFQGHWQCSGHFANGTAISSEEEFEPWLNGVWLHESHDDRPPFTYHAHSVWGIAKPANVLTLTIHDNFGGVRLFTSTHWSGASITFEPQPILAAAGKRERFIYERHPPADFSFEYQTATDAGEWKMGDHVDCRKQVPG